MAFLLEPDLSPKPVLEPSRRKLVVSVIEEYHGPIVATVADVLMRAERTTLADLTRLVQRDQGIMGVSRAGKTKTSVTAANVKEAMLIMMQHNMVTATMPTERELRRARARAGPRNHNIRLYYTLHPLQALVRTRAPQFHFNAKHKFGAVAGLVVDCFLRHGRRTLPDVKAEVLSKVNEAARRKEALGIVGAEGEGDDEDPTDESIQKSFEDLVMGKYIDKVPELDLVTASAEPEKAKKPSMTFAAAAGGSKLGSGKQGGAGAQTVASKTITRKRRMIAHGSHGSGGMEGTEESDEEDELPVEMRNMLGDGPGGDNGSTADARQPTGKRRKTSSGEAVPSYGLSAPRTRGRGRSRGRGGQRGTTRKGKVDDGPDMAGVFQEEGAGNTEAELRQADTAPGAGAKVLDGVVWKLGFDKFHRDFRNSTLLGLVQERFPKSRLVYLAVKIMLDNSSPTERTVTEQVTAAMSATTLFDKLCEAWPLNTFTKNKPVPDWRRFASWMSALCTDLTGMVSKIPGSDAQNPRYVVKLANMVQYMRTSLVRSSVGDRHGKESARIVQILLQHKYLEQQQVGEMAMLPSSDARERLYRLLRDRIVSVQEVPKRADRNPNTTFYLWTIKHDQANQVVLDSLYKAMLNMRLRRKFVYANDKELFIHDAAARLSNDAERDRLDQVRRSLDRLDTALLRLDENLMLFNTF